MSKSLGIGARGASASKHMNRWRAVIVALLVLAMVGSLLALAVPPPSVAGAQSTIQTQTAWSNSCIGRVGTIGQAQVEPLGFLVTHPAQVEPDSEFTVRVKPDQGFLPDKAFNQIVGEVTVLGLKDVRMMFNLPSNSEFISASIVPDSTSNTSGPYTVGLDTSFSSNRIVLFTQDVVKNPVPPDNDTPFQLPSFDMTLKATGPIGSNVSTRMSGFNEDNSGYTFRANNNYAPAAVRCWPDGEVPGPILFQTAISQGGGQTNPTTTALTVDPTTLPGGNDVTMTAVVTAPSGAVRFNDGGTVLGFAELNEDSQAVLVTALNNVGFRQITATYLGSTGFESSTSAPVEVTVTNPTNRAPTRVSVSAAAPTARVGTPATNTDEWVTTVSIDVSAISPGPTPSGFVRVYLDGDPAVTWAPGGQLFPVGLLPLGSDGAAEITDLFMNTGSRQLRVEYIGDTNYFPVVGSTPVIAKNTATASSVRTQDRSLSGGAPAISLNRASGAVPAGSLFNSTFRTDADGNQTLEGLAVFGSATYALANGGSITGQLAGVGGKAAGKIAPDGDAELSMSLFFQVASADFNDGAGLQDFASTCSVGPFDVHLTGERLAPGPFVLSGSDFNVPFPPAGSCVNASGVSRAVQVGGQLAGGFTSLDLTLASINAIAPGAATQVSPVTFSPAGGAPYGQPVTMSAVVSRVDGVLISGAAGAVEFYANGELIGQANLPAGSAQPKTASLTFPSASGSALPQGLLDVTARFVPSDSQSRNLATSHFSALSQFLVSNPIIKTPTTITVEAPAEAAPGEPVTVDITLDPAPNTITAPTPLLTGSIRLLDLSEPDPARQGVKLTSPANQATGLIDVTAASDGAFSMQTALAPGVHELQAVFEPAITSAWWWEDSTSEVVTHAVVGEAIPTSLTISEDSTRGTGKVAQGQPLYVGVQIDPQVVSSTGPFPNALVIRPTPDATLPFASTSIDAFGQAVFAITGNQDLGHQELTIMFNPSQWMDFNGGELNLVRNQGFAPSSVTFEYEVVVPGDPGPMPTGTEIVNVNPQVVHQGDTWSQVDGYVTFNAAGSVEYSARNTATSAVTGLGSAAVVTTTAAATGRGLARLASPAASASLPAGVYEVTGVFTPTVPANFGPSTSEPFVVHVLGASEEVDTETTLNVSPSGVSAPGQPVVLEASVSPGWASAGTVEFFDDGDSLGTAPVNGGTASILLYDLAPGEHELSAVFTPSESAVNGSSSDLIPHLVADPATPTETVLTIEPEGSSLEGEDITLTATVTAEDPDAEIGGPVGTVVFEDEHGEIGSAPVVDGVAVLITDELEAGTHEVVAVFQPDPESDFAGSVSEAVIYEVVAQSEPQPPLDVTASPGGLMATVSWDAPEDDGGQPISGFTVFISSGEEPEEWDFPVADLTAAVTTVDVIGLEADVDYSFKVTAWNSIGESELSEVSNTVTVGGATYEFTDMNPGDDFFDEITWMAEVGLSTGFEPGPEYRPGATLTRQAMSAFIYRLNGSPLGSDPQCESAPFPDVSTDNDFCGEIAWMADKGITQGNSDGTFNPTGAVSRQAMSAFLYRSANGPDAPPACTEAPFSDVPVADDFCPYIAWMKAEGISTGDPEGTFRPTLPVTRMAMSAFLYRYTLVVQTSVV